VSLCSDNILNVFIVTKKHFEAVRRRIRYIRLSEGHLFLLKETVVQERSKTYIEYFTITVKRTVSKILAEILTLTEME